jgi:hypothetical protein
MDCAIGRWRAATCLPIDISYEAAHWIRFKAPEDMPGGVWGKTSGSSWNRTRIAISTAMIGDNWKCQVLAHEISHVLRRDNDHVGPRGDISATYLNVDSVISESDVTVVCERQDCLCFNPEPYPDYSKKETNP